MTQGSEHSSAMTPPRAPIRVGLIGSGLMGAMHSETYRRVGLLSETPAFSLQRLASRNERTVAALASRFGWQEGASDWREVTRGQDIDVVDICTPEDSHHEIALDALAHGKHVFCEKPLAPTEAQARQMLSAARDSGMVHMTGFVLRYWPALRTARSMLDSGRLGAPHGVRARYLIDGRTLLESSLRGLGSHVLDAATYLLGPVSAVCALSRPIAEQPSIDAAVRALLKYESGVTGTLELDREARGQVMDIGLTVECADGSLSIAWKRREEITVSFDEPVGAFAGPQQVRIAAQDPPPLALFTGAGFGLDSLFIAQAQTLAAAISGAQVAYPDFSTGWRAAAVGEAAIASWQSESWVQVAGEMGGGRA